MRTLAGIGVLLVATASSAAPPHVSDGMLADQHGMALYVFGGKGTGERQWAYKGQPLYHGLMESAIAHDKRNRGHAS